jgi:hypothetical protein
VSDFFDQPLREMPWPRLFNRLKERQGELSTLILAGGLSDRDYAHHTGQYVAVTSTIEEMQAMMRGEDLPRKTELPEA